MKPSLTKDQENALCELKKRMAPFLETRAGIIRIFGSRARGDEEPQSDLDLAVIVPGLTREEKMRILETVAEVELEHLTPLSALVISKEAFGRLKGLERRIALDIEREGIPA